MNNFVMRSALRVFRYTITDERLVGPAVNDTLMRVLATGLIEASDTERARQRLIPLARFKRVGADAVDDIIRHGDSPLDDFEIAVAPFDLAQELAETEEILRHLELEAR